MSITVHVHVHDRELLRRTRSGDAAAFGAFYRARRGAAIDQQAADADLLAGLRAALPEDQFQAFIARVIDERGYAEIAHDLQTSQSVVRKRVSRAAAQLRSIRQEAS